MSESKSLLNIGSQCSHSTCNELDFLPIVCPCGKAFCRHHIPPGIHQCTVDAAANPSYAPFDKLQRCDVDSCSQPSLISSQDMMPTCLRCNSSFCAAHRHPSSHSCPVQHTPPPEKTTAARALLAKNFPTSLSKKAVPQRVTKVPTDPVKLAQYRKIELMKMRHRAAPGNPKNGPSSAPLDQRLHVKVAIDEGGDKVFWFHNSTITGKVLDYLAAHLKMRSFDEPRLQLIRVLPDDVNEVLLNDRAIADQVEDGDTLFVVHIDSK